MSDKPDKEPHGNSKDSQKPQHIYSIHDAVNNDEIAKFGISGQSLNADGTSPRAEEQVRKWNVLAGFKRFFAKILHRNVEGRQKALDIETDYVRKYKETHNGKLPPEQQRPNPKNES